MMVSHCIRQDILILVLQTVHGRMEKEMYSVYLYISCENTTLLLGSIYLLQIMMHTRIIFLRMIVSEKKEISQHSWKMTIGKGIQIFLPSLYQELIMVSSL